MDYTSQYPPGQSDTYVKATTKSTTDYWPHYTTDPAKSLIGVQLGNGWASGAGQYTNQRFHIDLGSGKVIKRIYYENMHSTGTNTDYGVQNFTLWGSNTAGDFADLVYANNGTWVELTVAQNTFDEHIGANQADPKYIVVTNSTAYRYYAFKFVDCRVASEMAIRRIELQIGDLPTVTTQAVTDVKVTTLTGNGNITLGEATTRGFCYMEGEAGDPTTANDKVFDTGSFGTGAYTKGITGLTKNTHYRVRAYAINAVGTSYGSTVQTTTDELEVTAQAVSDILSTTATGNGNITDTGGENATKRGICWNIAGNPTVADSKSEEEGSFGTGAFTAAITGLSPGVKYYVKAYAYNSGGYAYSSEVNFTTLKIAPTVTVQSPTDILTTTVTGNGNITDLGGENSTVRGFKYGLTQVDTWDAHDDGSFSTGAYTKGLTGLSANTTYWIRAYATNTIGTSYSEWIEFQTTAAGIIPTGTNINICSDYSGYTYQLQRSETDDGETYTAYFVISTDLTNKQGLSYYKRILDLYLYFRSESSGTAIIEVKRDSEASWQSVGTVSLTGTEDIIVKHLAPDIRAKHFLFKISAANFFRFLGCLFEYLPEEMR